MKFHDISGIDFRSATLHVQRAFVALKRHPKSIPEITKNPYFSQPCVFMLISCRFWLTLVSFLATFGLPLASFGLPLGPLWLTFGVLGLTFGAPGARFSHFCSLLASFFKFSDALEENLINNHIFLKIVTDNLRSTSAHSHTQTNENNKQHNLPNVT